MILDYIPDTVQCPQGQLVVSVFYPESTAVTVGELLGSVSASLC